MKSWIIVVAFVALMLAIATIAVNQDVNLEQQDPRLSQPPTTSLR